MMLHKCRVVLKRRKFLALFVGFGLILVFSFLVILRSFIAELECTDIKSIRFLDELCKNYSQGLITGSLCKPLCAQNEIRFSKCLGHGVKPHVLGASWRGAKIILKTANIPNYVMRVEYVLQSLNVPPEANLETFSITTDNFVKQACDNIYFELAEISRDSVTRMVRRVLAECDVEQDDVLYINEAVSCWHLLETKEYSFYQLLRGNSAFPQLLGVCGKMYAVGYAPSEPFLGFMTSWSEVRDWRFRAQLALALLEMVESLENTELGTVYLCDLQEGNFGVVRRGDRLVAKAIDMDISFFEHSLRDIATTEQNNSCSSDEDCVFVGCVIKCNMNTKKCSGVLSSSNLRGVCVHLFKLRYSHHPALLLNPPQAIAKELNKLLDLCVQSESPHTDMNLLKQLQALLISSIT